MKENLEYARKHLIYHLKQAGAWEKIKSLIAHPIFGKQAREAIKENEETESEPNN